jgi:hypothetical protein
MWLFPLAAAGVSGVFATQMARQFADRRRPHQLAWTLALTMFALASLATAQGVRGGWTPVLFRAFYLFGAMVNVPFLAAGTVYLLMPRPWGHGFAAVVGVASVAGLRAVVTAPLHTAALRAVGGIPDFALILAGPAPLARTMADYYSYTAFAIVVAGAVWSAVRLRRQGSERLRRLASGNILIATGTTVVAAASITIHFGKGSVAAGLFSVGLLAGISIMFAGFLRTRSRPPVAPVAGGSATVTGA